MDLRLVLLNRSSSYSVDPKSCQPTGSLAPYFFDRLDTLFFDFNVTWIDGGPIPSKCPGGICTGPARLLQEGLADMTSATNELYSFDGLPQNITITNPLVQLECAFFTHFDSPFGIMFGDCLTNLGLLTPGAFILTSATFASLLFFINYLNAKINQFIVTSNILQAFGQLYALTLTSASPSTSKTSQKILFAIILINLFVFKSGYNASFQTDLTVPIKKTPIKNIQDLRTANITPILTKASACFKTLNELPFKHKELIMNKFMAIDYFLSFSNIVNKLNDFTFLGTYWELDGVFSSLHFNKGLKKGCAENYEHIINFGKTCDILLINSQLSDLVKRILVRRIYTALEADIWRQLWKHHAPQRSDKCTALSRKNFSPDFEAAPMVMENYRFLFIVHILSFLLGMLALFGEIKIKSQV